MLWRMARFKKNSHVLSTSIVYGDSIIDSHAIQFDL